MNFFNTNPLKFSLAVSGNGALQAQLVEAIRRRFTRVVIYDRHEEANRPPSNHPIPTHPKVADIDVVFITTGLTESATVRKGAMHKYFNYAIAPELQRQVGLDFIQQQIVQVVELMLQPPEPVQEPVEEPEDSEKPEDSEEPEGTD